MGLERTLVIAVIVVLLAIELPIFTRERFVSGRRADRGSLAFLWLSLVASVAAAYLLNRVRPGRASPVAVCIGLFVALCGLGLRQWAVRTLGGFFTPVVSLQSSHHLVTGGPYAHLRHPGYTGLLLEVTGAVLATANVLAAAVAFCLVMATLHYRIQVEEKALLDRFGEAYRTYQSRTRRLIPLLY